MMGWINLQLKRMLGGCNLAPGRLTLIAQVPIMTLLNAVSRTPPVHDHLRELSVSVPLVENASVDLLSVI